MKKISKKGSIQTLCSTLPINTNLKASLLLVFLLLTLLAVVACASEEIDEGEDFPLKEQNLKVGEKAAFISVWEVPTYNKTIQLPLVETDYNNVGMYNFQVDWGDKSPIETITAWNASERTHTYRDAGEYTITITGSLVGWRFGDPYEDYYKLNLNAKKITQILQWGNLFLGRTHGFQFQGVENLKIVADDAPFLHADNLNIPSSHPSFDVSFLQDPDKVRTTNFNYAFYGALELKGNLDWDVSTVVSMKSTFHYAKNFNIDISMWNVTNVINMASMFLLADKFNKAIGKWGEKVGQVKDMSYMFSKTKAFNQDLSAWNVENVTNMEHMFDAPAFNRNITTWKVGNVKNMERMFTSAEKFNQDIGSWDVGKVTNMEFMFYNAESFDQNISTWDVGNVTDMESMFENAIKFNQDISDWNVKNVFKCERFYVSSRLRNNSEFHPKFSCDLF